VKYKLVLFDFDGTVADSFGCFLAAFNETAATHGFRPLEPEMVTEARGLSSQQLMRRLGIRFWRLPGIAVAMRQRMHARLSEVQLFPGIDELWHTLAQRGVGLGLVTSNSLANVSLVLGPEHLSRFAYLECSAGLFSKGRRLRRVLKQSGLPRASVLFVGDERRDAEAAQAAGLDFIGVSWGYATPAVLQPFSAGPLFNQVDEISARVCAAQPNS
jgi:phosphoglycolate phosphatase